MHLFYRKNGEGRPLIILHGLFGMSDNWMTLAKQFAENGFACYTVDLRNHGRSPHSDEFNFSVMAEDLSELMDDLTLSSASFLGHSLGGKTAMLFATMHPEKVEKLVVADIAPKYYPPHLDSETSALNSVDLNVINSRKEAEEQLRISLHDEATVQFLLKNLYWKEEIMRGKPGTIKNETGQGRNGEPVKDGSSETTKKLAWRFNLEALEKNVDAVGEALPENARFYKPTLFLRGEKSGYISEQDIPDIKKHFPQAVVKTITVAGHWIHAENPKGFMEAVLEFLNAY